MSASPTLVSTVKNPPLPLRQVLDFSERLSPMLVKELRQGMRSPVFVWGMITMNLLLGLIVWMTVLDERNMLLHKAFFGIYGLLVCGLLPLRASSALHDELKGNTIDTLVMTRLTGWRITLGKWIAVVALQCLTAVSVLPYLIVRYFAGGMNVWMELAWLGIFLLIGIGSAAVLTGFSWIKYFLFRAALMIGVTLTVGFHCMRWLNQIYGSGYSSGRSFFYMGKYEGSYLLEEMYQDSGWQGFALMALPAMHFTFFALDLGASRIGSVVENSSTRRRLVGVGFILAYLGIALSHAIKAQPGFFANDFLSAFPDRVVGWTVGIICLQSLLEKPVYWMPMVLPWVKRGWWGRLAARWLYPGWPSGVIFSGGLICSLAGLQGLVYFQKIAAFIPLGLWDATDAMDDGHLARAVSYDSARIGLLIVPLVAWRLIFSKRLPWHAGVYTLLLTLVISIQMAILALASALENNNLLKLGAFIPSMGLSWRTETISHTNGMTRTRDGAFLSWDFLDIAVISSIVLVSWWVVAVILALREFRKLTVVENEAALLLRAPCGNPEENV